MRSPPVARGRRLGAFTLVELLVVMAIIAALVALLLPAVQKVRQAAQRVQCSNNLRQMGLAMHHFETQNKHFPTGGEGTNPKGSPYARTYFDLHSFFTMILPFIEQDNIYDQMDLRYAYNDTVSSGIQTAAKGLVHTFICPSNPFRTSLGSDESGYGMTDYGATVYTDIDTATGVRNKNSRMDGALTATSQPFPPGMSDGAVDNCTYTAGSVWTNAAKRQPYAMSQLGRRQEEITDGLTTTIAIAEDVGRTDKTRSAYGDPVGGISTGNRRKSWRWAEPNSAFGVSGDPMATSDQLGTVNSNFKGMIRAINNNSTIQGGGTCDWEKGYAAAAGPPPLLGYTGGPNNNCGPNNEIFSFHTGGANALFCDGHVAFLSMDTTPVVVRYLVTANEGATLPAGADY